jgi:hypothetical protein
MTALDEAPAATADGRSAGISGAAVYRPEMLASYVNRPRRPAGSGWEPDRLRPRWRWAVIALALLGATTVAALAVRVPAGPVATIVGSDGRRVVLALPGADPPRRGEVIELDTARGVLRGVVNDTQAGGPSALMVMALVELERPPPPGALPVNGQVRLRAGTTPLLIDILTGGD